MKTSKYSDSLIMNILKQAEAGTPIPNLCREHGMSSATLVIPPFLIELMGRKSKALLLFKNRWTTIY